MTEILKALEDKNGVIVTDYAKMFKKMSTSNFEESMRRTKDSILGEAYIRMEEQGRMQKHRQNKMYDEMFELNPQ